LMTRCLASPKAWALLAVALLLLGLAQYAVPARAVEVTARQEGDVVRVEQVIHVSLQLALVENVVKGYAENVTEAVGAFKENAEGVKVAIEEAIGELEDLLEEADELPVSEVVARAREVLKDLRSECAEAMDVVGEIASRCGREYPWVKDLIRDAIDRLRSELERLNEDIGELLNAKPRDRDEAKLYLEKLIAYLQRRKGAIEKCIEIIEERIGDVEEALEEIKKARRLRDIAKLERKYRGLLRKVLREFVRQHAIVWGEVIRGDLLRRFMRLSEFREEFCKRLDVAMEKSLARLYGKTGIHVENLTIDIEFEREVSEVAGQTVISWNLTIRKSYVIKGVVEKVGANTTIHAKFRYLNVTEEVDLSDFHSGWVMKPCKALFDDLTAFNVTLEEWSRTYIAEENITVFEYRTNVTISLPIGCITVDPVERVIVEGTAYAEGDTITSYAVIKVPVVVEVLDVETREPVASANVTLWKEGKVVASGLTDSRGRVELRVEPGTYVLTVDKEHYIHYETEINVQAPKVEIRPLLLEPRPKVEELYNLIYIALAVAILAAAVGVYAARKRR